ncbi:MAG TPA: hypothetical protein VKD71_12225 [Gemmataceae bacterium]|nr:hypothetical protein [Gemmataceae bacterium]
MARREIEDLSTGAPFVDPKGQDVECWEELEAVLGEPDGSGPRVLKLSTPKYTVYFGVGHAVSFVEYFDWCRGRAYVARPPKESVGAYPVDFQSREESVRVVPAHLMPLRSALVIVRFFFDRDEPPGTIEWVASP